jgi:hypothetical protein
MSENVQEILVIAGSVLVIVVFIWWKFRDSILLKFRPVKTTGIITNWMSATEKGVRVFYPLIEFHDEKGVRHNYRADERCENEPMYPQGTSVEVHYLAKNPKMVRTIYPKSV